MYDDAEEENGHVNGRGDDQEKFNKSSLLKKVL